MSSAVLTTTPATMATDASLLIALHDITALPVLEDGRLVGMFREQDLLRNIPAGDQTSCRVGDVMEPVRLTAHPDGDLPALAEAMRHHGVRSVPVLDHERRLVGIISYRDLPIVSR
jgi:acetoin utilization protein AcuB